MPRPPDNYTHAQFEPIESDHQGETVRCRHCKHWNGSIKTLNRKKEHLLKCPAYASWRAAGNGQDLAPPNRYNRRDGPAPLDDSSLYGASFAEVNYTPNPPRHKLHDTDLSKAFDEFWDDAETQRCMRARCKYCGAVRAKNTTRQYEHLQQCQDFLDSAEGQQAQANGTLHMTPMDGSSAGKKIDIWRGSAPNPVLSFARPQAKPRQSAGRPSTTPAHRQPPRPSLVNHLLFRHRAAVEQATQLPFLSHAGCGTLSQAALRQWLCQQGHLSRALTSFIGSLIGKIRLPDTKNPQADTSFRAFDLLVSTLNNAQRELEFLRSTELKYGLSSDAELPKFATKGLIDLFANTASPSASLLEGFVVLWAIEHLYHLSWQYAATFYQPAAPAPTPYSLPSYLHPTQYSAPGGPHGGAGLGGAPGPNGSSAHNNPDNNAHVAALHEALIPNWTSHGFEKFVEVCRAIVDELANAQTTGSGAAELGACEAAFTQVCWLARQVWPLVTGMGEHEENVVDGSAAATAPPPPPPAGAVGVGTSSTNVVGGAAAGGGAGGAAARNGGASASSAAAAAALSRGAAASNAMEIADDDDDDDDDDIEVDDAAREDVDDDEAGADSPYGGTGLGAVAAANRSG